MRKRYPSSAAAWNRALAKAEPTLEQVAVDCAVNGVAEPDYQGGRVVGHRRRYSDLLMRDALKRKDARVSTSKTKADLVADAPAAAQLAGGHFHLPQDNADVVEYLTNDLSMLAVRLRREEEAEAERLLAAGLVP